MKIRRFILFSVLCVLAVLRQPSVWAQSVSVRWTLSSDQSWISTASTLATGAPEIVSGGSSPTVSVFDYFSGQAQRLNAGSTGWTAGPMDPTRYLQFDASPTPGHQLTVTNIQFQYGDAHVPNQIRADVQYSTDNWTTSHTLTTGIWYGPWALVTYSSPVTAPTIPPGGKFSLRIFPYAAIDSTAGSPTFAGHSNVVINADSSPAANQTETLQIFKSTGTTMVPGTYGFYLTCSPIPFSGPASVTLPGSPVATVQIPIGDICHISENQLPGWGAPTFAGNGVSSMPNTWDAQTSNINSGLNINVTNHPPNPKTVTLELIKSTGARLVPGTYSFQISCTGPGGPFTATSTITLPGSPTSVQVPQGDICTVSETPIAGWNNPLFSGPPDYVVASGWSAQIGPIDGNTTETVTNQPGKNVPNVRLEITKSTGDPVVPGNYTFNLSCSPIPYAGSSSFNVTLPGSPVIEQVPQGDTCTLTETQISGWGTPSFSGNGVTGNGWSAQIGPMNTNTAVDVMNKPGKQVPNVRFQITKSTGDRVVPGTYTFNINCSPVPYAGTNPITLTLPGSPATLSIPEHDICTLSETPIAGWGNPDFGGPPDYVQANGWSAQIGPVDGNSGITVSNKPPKQVPNVKFQVTKSTGARIIPGSYTFDIACSPLPYAGLSPFTITLPGSPAALSVPAGDTCTLTEHSQTGWGTPTFTASPANVLANGWSAQIGPVNSGTAVTVTNHKGDTPPANVKFQITKSTGDRVVPGTYTFNISCSPVPYAGTNPITLTLPGSPATLSIPEHDICTLSETPIAGWGNPDFGGPPDYVQANGWSAQIGPIDGNSGIIVKNQPPPKPQNVRFQVTKSTGDRVVPGTYTFNITCSPVPYAGTNPITLTLPGSPATLAIPEHDMCTLSETPIAGWGNPDFGGPPDYVVANGWSAQIGPIDGNSGIIVKNQPGKPPPMVKFQLTKSTTPPAIPGSYTFNVSCSPAPYTGQNPITLTLPGTPVSTQPVPQGDTCTFTETPLAGWNTPVFFGSGVNVSASGWSAQVGPINTSSGVDITNRKGDAPPPNVKFQIVKSTGPRLVPGAYTFHLTCGPVPYNGPNPITLNLPGSPGSVAVPQGDTCTLTEVQITGWGTPTFSGSPANVVPNGWSAQVGPINTGASVVVSNNPPKQVPNVRFQITKNTSPGVIPGSYPVNITCSPVPYAGTSPVTLTLPGSPATLSVPQGDTCTLTETALLGWNSPIFTGSGVNISSSGWSAQVGPINTSSGVDITNRKGDAPPPNVKFQIVKSTGPRLVPGAYTFHLTCGPVPYNGPNPITLNLPGSPGSVAVPQGDTCTLTEVQLTGWGTPTFSGSPANVVPNGWSAQVGPINTGASVIVSNNPPKQVPNVRFQITKNTSPGVIPGSYPVNITCSPVPYAGTSPVTLTLPGSPATLSVPQGDTCTLTETALLGWNSPIFTGSGVNVSASGWSAQVGPINTSSGVDITNRKGDAPPPNVKFQIVKSTGPRLVPGAYTFHLTCGPVPYNGPNPITLNLPGSPGSVAVPQGDTCTLTEDQLTGWGTPTFSGSPANVVPNGWSAQVGPINTGASVIVSNNPPANNPSVRLQLIKSTGPTVVPGTYHFNLSCTGPGGPYTGQNPISLTLPGSGSTVLVPQGDTCTLTETQVTGFNTPTFAGSGVTVTSSGWSAQIGPINSGGIVTATNHPPGATTMNLQIEKLVSGRVPVNGMTVTFYISICTGGTYTGPLTIPLSVPPNPASGYITVPVGATCTISENPIPGWSPPTISGTQPLIPSGWSVRIGPFHPSNGGDRVQFNNHP